MRKRIEEYLQQGIGGKFYYRMVDTVLSRDKNWVRWKAEGCPPIERPAVSVTEYLGARERATKIYANKRLRSSPAGALDLKFLLDDDSLKQLKEPVRCVLLKALNWSVSADMCKGLLYPIQNLSSRALRTMTWISKWLRRRKKRTIYREQKRARHGACYGCP